MRDSAPERSNGSPISKHHRDTSGLLGRNAGDVFIEALADAVARRLETMAGLQQRLLDVHGAARYLGMTEDAVRHKAGTDIPCVRVDGKLRFDRRDLDRWIDQAPREGV
jgi:hypothetical protein